MKFFKISEPLFCPLISKKICVGIGKRREKERKSVIAVENNARALISSIHLRFNRQNVFSFKKMFFFVPNIMNITHNNGLFRSLGNRMPVSLFRSFSWFKHIKITVHVIPLQSMGRNHFIDFVNNNLDFEYETGFIFVINKNEIQSFSSLDDINDNVPACRPTTTTTTMNGNDKSNQNKYTTILYVETHHFDFGN